MGSIGDKAEELFRQGYNCAQSVFGAAAEYLDMDFNSAVKVSSGFGGGMGRMREVCGALTGAFMAAGLKYGESVVPSHDSKTALYKKIQEIAAAFKAENGSIICRELLGLQGKDINPEPGKRTDEYYKKRPCVEMVRQAAELVKTYILEE